ncbi:MAG: hypothetical protein ACREN1_09800 [Candidatus Dormibacteria bacterium]
MNPARLQFPRLTPGKWITLAVIAFILIASVFDTINSLKQATTGEGPPQAQLNGKLPRGDFRVGQRGTLTFALDATSGGAMSPACVGGNLTPEFKVLRVTFLGTAGSEWRHGRSCGGTLETNSVVPVVITLVPLHPGSYTLRLQPQVNGKRAGSGTEGQVTVVS